MILENEDVKFDYFNGTLTIKADRNYVIYSNDIKQVERFFFKFDGNKYNVIMIDMIFRGQSRVCYFSDISYVEGNNISLAIANKNGEILEYLYNEKYGAEHGFWKNIFALAYKKYDFGPFSYSKEFHKRGVTNDFCDACFSSDKRDDYFMEFDKNNFNDFYDSIVNYFLPDKIEYTRKFLISKGYEDNSQKKSELDRRSHEERIREELHERLLKFQRENDEAVLKQKSIVIDLGNNFENEDFVICTYKKSVADKLYQINVTFDSISEFIETEMGLLSSELNFWNKQSVENRYVERNWIEKYIWVIICKKDKLCILYDDFINKNNDALLFDINSSSRSNYENNAAIPYRIAETIVDYVNEVINAYDDERAKCEKKFDYYNNVIAVSFLDDYTDDEYNKLIKCKMDILKSMYLSSLENVCGKISDKKIELLEQIRRIVSKEFNTGVNLYREYDKLYKLFYNNIKNNNHNLFYDINCAYNEFYYYGRILISNHLKKINRKPDDGKHNFPESEVQKAMMYFYNTQTIEEAEEKHRARDYIENQKNGLSGENEVNYALKWLDKSYINISKKHGGAISLYNPDFIDESQQYDQIVVGRQGVFNIETKKYAGKLIVDDNGNWIRIKKDGTKEGERNPIQQVRRHEKLLRSIIDNNIPIINVICMAHPKMIIEGVQNCPVPLVKSDLLVEFIEGYESDVNLSGDEIKNCVAKIESYIIKKSPVYAH